MLKLSSSFFARKYSIAQILFANTLFFSLTVGIIAFYIIIFSPLSELNYLVSQAEQISNSEIVGSQIHGLSLLKKAEIGWPILKFNRHFQDKLSTSQNRVDEYKKNNPAVLLFLKDNIPQSEVDLLIQQLNAQPGVSRVELVTKDQAMKRYQANFLKSDPKLLDLVKPQSLPASIEIFFNDWSKRKMLKSYYQNNPIIEHILIPLEDQQL